MSALQKHTHSFQELNREKESWNIVARVVRLWFVEDYTKGKSPFSIEIVLQDKKDSTECPSQPLTQLCQSSKVSLEEDFIKLHLRSSIEGLKDFKQESTFVVKTTIKHVLDHDDWWYTTCICNKAVYPDSKIDVIPPSIHDPSSPTSSGSPLRGPTTRSMMRKIQMGIPLNDHQD
ncbi:hypothetical protein DEO72_LG7g1565 [Vigna unguiculata]|uniref:Uncharacterized protein n=1 Tax=Vigna unguiculata TaxID=3917 RepID=A0A4D6MFY1_VIGUN|nr:hypothetical protein DEO72_LG7g1565 [Vigna unguiculata]